MNSLQSLREIRAMEFFLYGGIGEQEYSQNRTTATRHPSGGEVVAIVTYNLKTRQFGIKEKRVSPDGKITE